MNLNKIINEEVERILDKYENKIVRLAKKKRKWFKTN